MLRDLRGIAKCGKRLQMSRDMTSRTSTKVIGTADAKQPMSEKVTKNIGVLLINTGTPSDYSCWSIMRYLREFLSDPRVIELPRILWWPILHLFVLTTRPLTTGKHYKSVWNMELDESPLRTVTRNQAAQLANRMRNYPVIVDWAFRYGEPSIKSQIHSLNERGCDKLVLFPLFPQFSAVTRASIFDESCRHLMKQRHQMTLSVVAPFHADEMYLDAVVGHIEGALCKCRLPPQIIVVSYHGIPLSYQIKGDPYGFQCQYTTSLLRKKLRLRKCDMLTTFQSRFGNQEWLKPYTEDTVVQLAKNGVKRIMVIAPGFVSDCLETTKELGCDLAESFRKHGGEDYLYVPNLNDSIEAVDLLESLSLKHIHCFL